jgi:competence protein ComEA
MLIDPPSFQPVAVAVTSAIHPALVLPYDGAALAVPSTLLGPTSHGETPSARVHQSLFSEEDSMFRTVLPLVTFAALFAAPPSTLAAQSPSTPPSARAAKPAAAAAIVNINTASASEIEGLPGIGAKTAARIVEYRQKNGPFKKIEELMNVRGIGEKNFLKLKPQLTVGAAKADHAQQQ